MSTLYIIFIILVNINIIIYVFNTIAEILMRILNEKKCIGS